MSITFFLTKHGFSQYDAINPHYNPNQPEDSFFNPKTSRETIFFEINLSNINAISMMKVLGLPAEYGGSIESDKIDEFVRNINKLQSGEHSAYIQDKLSKFDRLGRMALALNDGISWG